MNLTISPDGLPIVNLPLRKFDLKDKVQTIIIDSIDGKEYILTGEIIGYVYQFENIDDTSLIFFDYSGWVYYIVSVENYNGKMFYYTEKFRESEISKIE